MSLYAPGTFATPTQKSCAAQTGYVFTEPMVDPFDTMTNSQAVKDAYNNCVAANAGNTNSQNTSPIYNSVNNIHAPAKAFFGLAAIFVVLKIAKVI